MHPGTEKVIPHSQILGRSSDVFGASHIFEKGSIRPPEFRTIVLLFTIFSVSEVIEQYQIQSLAVPTPQPPDIDELPLRILKIEGTPFSRK
jgi:hypothetical protein